jgi:UDP-N-acetylmuramoyl-L-alanyl-D-glutamate--2,6-diaminopimelate ligase
MGAAVCRGSDQVILTSDNPRFEDPRAIVDDTLQGMSGCEAAPTVILDRAEAIAALFDHLAEYPMDQPWVALIAGKGHEPYIDQNGVKRPYSDREQVLRNLRRLGWAST